MPKTLEEIKDHLKDVERRIKNVLLKHRIRKINEQK
jgi:hypothetical protein